MTTDPANLDCLHFAWWLKVVRSWRDDQGREWVELLCQCGSSWHALVQQ